MPHILFAENGPTAMTLAGGLFDLPDIALDVVTDGRSALDRVNAEPSAYHLVILGDDLPEISGPECASFLRRMYRRLPILMLVQNDDAAQQCAGLNIHILHKPIDPTVLADSVQQILADAPPRSSPRDP